MWRQQKESRASSEAKEPLCKRTPQMKVSLHPFRRSARSWSTRLSRSAHDASRRVDETEEVEFGYCWRPEFLRQDTAEMRRSARIDAGWQTVFRYTSGRVRCYRDGRMTDVNALASGTEVTLPQTGAVGA